MTGVGLHGVNPHKVDTRLIEQARKLRHKGRTQDEIAIELGVSQGTISVILRAIGLGGKLIRKPSPLSLLRLNAER